MAGRKPPAVLAFDVNETLLDLSALDPLFASAFGRAGVRTSWFLTMQGVWMAGTLTGRFVPFDRVAGAALEITAAREGVTLTAELRTAVVKGMERLPAFPEVAPALAALDAAGVRLAALTNSTNRMARAQLKFAGLFPLFEQVLSVESVKRYKPSPEPYLYAARRLKVKPSGMYMVAAHAWDTGGAAAAGLKTVFVKRPGKILTPGAPKPDLQVTDLAELARRFS
ncbi:MAG TPA: haloacid dehalogenase type II [Vicinamibacterales bacterium]|jgi:2-haloacid dehalogenase